MAGKKAWTRLWQKLKPGKSTSKACAGQSCSRDLATVCQQHAAQHSTLQHLQEVPVEAVQLTTATGFCGQVPCKDCTTTLQSTGEQGGDALASTSCNAIQATHMPLQSGPMSNASCASCSSAGPATLGCGDSVSSGIETLARTLPHVDLALASRSSSTTSSTPVVNLKPPSPRIHSESSEGPHRSPSPNFLTRATPPTGLFDLELLPCRVTQTLGSMSSISSGTPTCAMPNYTPELPSYSEAAGGHATEEQCRSVSLVLSGMGTDADAANSASGIASSIAAAAGGPLQPHNSRGTETSSNPTSAGSSGQLTLAPLAANGVVAMWPQPSLRNTPQPLQTVEGVWDLKQSGLHAQDAQAAACKPHSLSHSHVQSSLRHIVAAGPAATASKAVCVPVPICASAPSSSTGTQLPRAPQVSPAPRSSPHSMSVPSAPWAGSATRQAPARQQSGAGAKSSLPEIQMLWPLCLTTDQGASFLSVKVVGSCRCGEQQHTSRLARSDSHASAQSNVSVCILLDATPLAVLGYNESSKVVGGPVPPLCPSQQASSTGLQVACAFATCPPTATNRCGQARARLQSGSDGVLGVPGPAVSVLSVPACVAQELHLQFALWVDAQIAEDQAQAIHTGSPQFPGLADLHGLQQAGYSVDNQYMLNPASVSSPSAIPDSQPPTSSALTRGSLLDGLFDVREQKPFGSGGRKPEGIAAADPTARGSYQRSHTSHLPIIPKPRQPSWLANLHAAQLPESLGSTPNSSQWFVDRDTRQTEPSNGAHQLEMSQSFHASHQRFGSRSVCTTPSASSPSSTPCFARCAAFPDSSVGRLSLGAECPPPWLLSQEISQAATTVWAKQFVPLARDLSYLVLCVPAAFDHQRLSLCGEGEAALDALSKTWDRKTYCTALARMVCQLEAQQLWHTLAALLTHAGEHGVFLKCKGVQLHSLDLTAHNLQRLLQGVAQTDIGVSYFDSASSSCTQIKDTQDSTRSTLQDLARPAVLVSSTAPGLAALNNTLSTSSNRRARSTVGAGCSPPAAGLPELQDADIEDSSQPAASSLQRRASLPILTSQEVSSPPSLQHAVSGTCPLCSKSSHPCDSAHEVQCTCSMPLAKMPCPARPCSTAGSATGALMTTHPSVLSGLPTDAHTVGRTRSACTSCELRQTPVRGFSSMDEARVLNGCVLDGGEMDWGHTEFLDHQDRRPSITGGHTAPNRQQTDTSWPGMQSPLASAGMSVTPDGRGTGLAMESIMSSAANQWVQLLADSAGVSDPATLGWPTEPDGASNRPWGSLDHQQASHYMAGRTVSSALRTSLSSPTAGTDKSTHASLGGCLLSPMQSSSRLPAFSQPVAFASTLLGAGTPRGVRTPAHVLRATFKHLQDVDPWRWHARVLVEQLALIFLCMVLLLCLYL